jgi:hypothetical protein
VDTAGILTAGTLYLGKIPVRVAMTATNIVYVVSVAGVGASTGSFVGLYSSSGTLLSGSADIGAALLGTGAISSALTTPQVLAAGSFVWAAFLENLATTQPTLREYGTPTFVDPNLNLTAAAFRAATNGTGLTTLPASITPSANAGTGVTIWLGIS